jgi:hypothetical protein
MNSSILTESKHYSRAGKACQLKFKILLDKEKILSKDKSVLYRTSSQPVIENFKPKPLKIISDLRLVSNKKSKEKITPSAAFLSPGRTEAAKEVQSNSEYNISYKLVHKTPVFYSMSKKETKKNKIESPESVLTPNLHLFPEEMLKRQKGLKFKLMTPRKDLLIGQPSPHEERFVSHNLIPKSCSKYSFVSSPRFDKYADRKEFYTKKEHSPDYRPNKEFILPRITKDIVFRATTERKIKELEPVDVNLRGEKRSLIEELVKKKDRAKRNSILGINELFFD